MVSVCIKEGGVMNKRRELEEAKQRRARKIFLKYIMNSKKVILVVLIVLIGIIYSFFQANIKVKSMKNKLNNLEQEVKVLDREVEVLDQKLAKVNSEEFVEEIARKELGLVKPGEILYITIDEDKDKRTQEE